MVCFDLVANDKKFRSEVGCGDEPAKNSLSHNMPRSTEMSRPPAHSLVYSSFAALPVNWVASSEPLAGTVLAPDVQWTLFGHFDRPSMTFYPKLR